jgi:hypothetical protein
MLKLDQVMLRAECVYSCRRLSANSEVEGALRARE